MKAPDASCRLYARALKSIPGGVNSPVRACKAVGADPLFIRSAEGAVIVDVDGNRYIDYIGSWGPMILGHGHPGRGRGDREGARSAARASARRPRPRSKLAELVIEAVPSIEKVRLVNSGTEAAMSAIRLARGLHRAAT